ncbi:hypothetical protein F2P81_021032 [Scophthalmus maximus]|uniref:Uncharacterized protein n=1 Tax=Scophthalmus maximus TaxID=52904 RepID=A0A6A4S1Z8_SCOMX|nr:hypothetical protein F2P81_021032 [Scophthalmus maximus]
MNSVIDLIVLFTTCSHSPAMAFGERGSSLGPVWQQPLLHCACQQGRERSTGGDLQTHRLHHTGEVIGRRELHLVYLRSVGF